MDIETVSINLKNLMNKWFYTRDQIHDLLENYVTVDNNGILTVGVPTADQITLTTTNNAITNADIGELKATVKDANNNKSYGVPVQFLNRNTREVLHNGVTDENGECQFNYFTGESEIIPIQAKISNDFIFHDEGRLNSYTAWRNSTALVAEHTNAYTRLYIDEDDTSGNDTVIYSPVLTGYNDIIFKVRQVDGAATDTFCGIVETNSSGTIVANGVQQFFSLNNLELSVNEWHNYQISILDDRIILQSKDASDYHKIDLASMPSYYSFVFICNGNITTIDYCDLKINKCSDDLTMFIKDKDNLLTHNQWSCGECLNNTTGFNPTMGGRLSVTEEYNTIGDKSLKSTTAGSGTSIDMVYVVNEEQIGNTGSVSVDAYSTSAFMAYLLFRSDSSSGQAAIKSSILIPSNESTHITLTIPEILSDTWSVFIRLQNNNGDELFIDNCILNLN